MPICRVPGCVKRPRYIKHELCETHYWDIVLAPSRPRCSVEGCDGPQRAKGMCSTHYYRVKRHGSTDLWQRKESFTTSNGYTRVYVDCGHLFRDASGTAYEHRIVLFDRIGYGPHRCHWCSKPIGWNQDASTRIDVDHLDCDRSHNVPDNLVPACHPCNTARGTAKDWAPPNGVVDMSSVSG